MDKMVFVVSEKIGATVFVVFLVILCFNKRRWDIMRRYLVLLGSLFLVRCATMAATRLPVPSVHHKCEPKEIEDAWDFAREAWTI